MDRFSDHIDMVESRLDHLLDASGKHQTLTSGNAHVFSIVCTRLMSHTPFSKFADLSEQYETMARSLEDLARGRQEDNRLEREICWCWRRGCVECHEFSSSMLGISKQMHGIAETLEGHVSTLQMFGPTSLSRIVIVFHDDC